MLNIKNGIIQDQNILGVPFRAEIIRPVTYKHRPTTKTAKTHTVYHETGNPRSGADAPAHSRLLQNWEKSPTLDQTSWHFVVDDNFIIQNIPIDEIAYCQGTAAGNRVGISIEQCINNPTKRHLAEDNACKLHAALQRSLNLKISKHQDWSGKHCPATILKEGRWSEILRKIASFGSSVLPKTPRSLLLYQDEAAFFALELSRKLDLPLLSKDAPYDLSDFPTLVGIGEAIHIQAFPSGLTHFINARDNWGRERNLAFIDSAVRNLEIYRL